MLTMQPIGFAQTPYARTKEIPKGLGAQHNASGILEIKPEFEPGLLDIEGFSHLFIIWVFDRAEGFELQGIPPTDNRVHGVFATRSPRRPNPLGLTVVELQTPRGLAAAHAWSRYARWHTYLRHQTLSFERLARSAAPRSDVQSLKNTKKGCRIFKPSLLTWFEIAGSPPPEKRFSSTGSTN